MTMRAEALSAAFGFAVTTAEFDLEGVGSGAPMLPHLRALPNVRVEVAAHKAACPLPASSIKTLMGVTKSELAMEALLGACGEQASALVLLSRVCGTIPPPMLPILTQDLELTWQANSYLMECHKNVAKQLDPTTDLYCVATPFRELFCCDRVGRQSDAARASLAPLVARAQLAARRMPQTMPMIKRLEAALSECIFFGQANPAGTVISALQPTQGIPQSSGPVVFRSVVGSLSGLNVTTEVDREEMERLRKRLKTDMNLLEDVVDETSDAGPLAGLNLHQRLQSESLYTVPSANLGTTDSLPARDEEAIVGFAQGVIGALRAEDSEKILVLRRLYDIAVKDTPKFDNSLLLMRRDLRYLQEVVPLLTPGVVVTATYGVELGRNRGGRQYTGEAKGAAGAFARMKMFKGDIPSAALLAFQSDAHVIRKALLPIMSKVEIALANAPDPADATVQLQMGRVGIMLKVAPTVTFDRIMASGPTMLNERTRISINSTLADFPSVMNLLNNAIILRMLLQPDLFGCRTQGALAADLLTPPVVDAVGRALMADSSTRDAWSRMRSSLSGVSSKDVRAQALTICGIVVPIEWGRAFEDLFLTKLGTIAGARRTIYEQTVKTVPAVAGPIRSARVLGSDMVGMFHEEQERALALVRLAVDAERYSPLQALLEAENLDKFISTPEGTRLAQRFTSMMLAPLNKSGFADSTVGLALSQYLRALPKLPGAAQTFGGQLPPGLGGPLRVSTDTEGLTSAAHQFIEQALAVPLMMMGVSPDRLSELQDSPVSVACSCAPDGIANALLALALDAPPAANSLSQLGAIVGRR